MRKRNVAILFRLNKKEAEVLDKKVKKSGLNREAYLRQLISGVVPRDAPPPDYYSMMRELHKIGNNLNQIAQKACLLYTSTRSKLLFFRDVYDWIQNHISIITPDTPLIDLEYYYDDNSLKLINKLIKTFDTGISQVKIEEITLDELSNALPKSVFDKMMQHVKNRMEEQEEPSFRMTMRSKETFFNIEVEGHSEPKVTTIRLHHNKSFYEFGFDEESDGTRRLFDLMDMLLNKREDVLYVVDELERSLHPKLTERFLQLFMQLHEDVYKRQVCGMAETE